MVRLLPRIEAVFADESGSVAALTLTVSEGTTVVDAFAAMDSLVSVITSMTGCVLIHERVSYKSRVDLPDVAVSGSSVAHSGLFLVEGPTPAPGAILSVPGLLDDLLLTSGPFAGTAINRSDSRVVDFVSSLVDAGMVNPFGDVCNVLVAAYLISRR